MANSAAFHTQLASIMEVLANAAVAEICELVDNGYAVLHLEISEGQKENEVLRRKLRMMELKMSRASALRAGMGSAILAHSRSRAHVGMESKRTSSSEVQCRRAVDSHLVTSLFRDGKSSGDSGQITTQRKPAALDEIKLKSPIIKEERREEAWDNHDQQERLSTGVVNHSVDGGERHSNINTEAAQPISKQENASSCIWVSGETDNSLFPESNENLSVNKRSQTPALEDGDGILDHVGFDCMMFEPPRQLGTISTQGPGADLPECSYSHVDVLPIHSDSGNGFPYTMNKVSRSITEHKQPVAYKDNRQRVPPDEPHMTVLKGMETGSNALVMTDGWVSHDSHNNDAVNYNQDGTAGNRFICSFCGKTLACLKNLKTHLRVHTGEKPFSCMQCGKRFSDSSNLKRHQSVHTGERRYGCSHCGKRFAQSGHLKVHLSVHTGCKQFRCPQCGKTFISANHLKRHISVHDGEESILPNTFQLAFIPPPPLPPVDNCGYMLLSPVGKELNNFCSDGEHPSKEDEDSVKHSYAVMKYMVKEMGKPECIQIKEERLEDTISLQNDPMIKGSVKSGADEDKMDLIGHTQTDSLFEDYDPHINADQERERTIQKFQHTNFAHSERRPGYSGLWTPRSTETGSEDPVCSYSEEISPTRVTAHTKQQQQTSVAEESTLFAIESHNVKPVAAIPDSEPYEEKCKSSSNDNDYYDNDSINDLHLQNSISYEASENFGNLDERCFSNSQVNMRGNTARPKVGIVQRYMAGHKMQHRVGKREKRFVCGFCRKCFTCPKYLQSHQRVHTGEKPFSCSQCGKRFGQAVYLKKHQNVHTGEKPFVCPLCGKQFADASNLIRHKSVHTGERPFI